MLFSLVLACQLVLELDFSEGELHHCWYWQKCTQNPCKGIRKVCGLQRGESPSLSCFSVPCLEWLMLIQKTIPGKRCTICLPILGIKTKFPEHRASAHLRGISLGTHWLSGTILSKVLFKVKHSKDNVLCFYSTVILF